MITPRGKINVHFLKNTLKLTGPSNDYKIQYSNIFKAFLLPRQDGDHIAFVIGLKQPMRQGNTNYSFIVFQFKKGNKQEVKLTLPEDEKERKAIIKNPIDLVINEDLYDIMAKLFKSIIGIGVVIPGKFRSSQNIPSFKCTYGANEGYFYPLERNLIFITKPTLLISHEDIQTVNCDRLSESSQRYFEMVVHRKKGDALIFNNIERKEYLLLKKYFEEKNIKVTSDEDIEGEDNVIKTTKVRKAPEIEPDELPSEEDEFDDESFDGVDDDLSEDEESQKDKKNKKDKKDKKR